MATNSYRKEENDNDLEYMVNFDDHVIFNYINQWEKHSIGKIQLAAQQARNDLIEIFNSKNRSLINTINQLNKQLEQKQNLEIYLNKSKQQLIKLQQDLSKFFSHISLEHDQDQLPIYLIKLNYDNIESLRQIHNNTDEVINVPGTVPITLTMLNNVTPIDQIQMLGERLFVLVQQIEPKLAAKITGMFLELHKQNILTLIGSQKILKEKVEDAIKVLQIHQYKQRSMNKV